MRSLCLTPRGRGARVWGRGVRKIDRDDPLEPPPGVLKGVSRDGIDGSVIPG